MDRFTIETGVRMLIEHIRAFSRRQAALWQRVPYLALEADGRTGFNDNHSRAYRQGVWAVDSCVNGNYTIYVDLATGELIDPFAFHEKGEIKPASDAGVLTLATKLAELDAFAVVQRLEERAREPVASYYDRATQQRWREETRREYKLTAIYDAKRSRDIAPARYVDDRVL